MVVGMVVMGRIRWPERQRQASLNVRFPRALCVVSIAAAAIGAAYLWAALFGDGLHGLQVAGAVDNSDTFPNAKVAFIAAVALFGAAPLGVLIAGFAPEKHPWLLYVAPRLRARQPSR
jgi:hypothetical protein